MSNSSGKIFLIPNKPLEKGPFDKKGGKLYNDSARKKSLNLVSESSEKRFTFNHNHQKQTQLPSQSTTKIPSFWNNEVQINQRLSLKIDIDKRMDKAYRSIAKNRSIQLVSSKKNGFVGNNSSNQANSRPDIQAFLIQKESISTQLPYQLLRTYVMNIYDEYNIRDPLQMMNGTVKQQHRVQPEIQHYEVSSLQTPPKRKNIKFQESKMSTKKKILLMKNNFINELKTNNTTEKKPNTKQQKQKNTFNEAVQLNNLTTQNLQSDFNVKEKNKRTKIMFEEQTNKKKIRQGSQQSMFNRIQHSQNKNINNFLTDTKISLSSNGELNIQSIYDKATESAAQSLVFGPSNIIKGLNQSVYVRQVFRYCFVCEQPILQVNISLHQKSCRGLYSILTKPQLTKEQLMQMIDKKISKIENDLKVLLIKTQPEDTTFKLSQIKGKVLDWITNFSNKFGENEKTLLRKSIDEERRIDELVESTGLMRILDLINKLKWFIHLRSNFLLLYCQ